MVRFDQNRIVFEDEDNIDQYRVELLDTGELEIEYLLSGNTWKFENDGTLDADSLNVVNYNDSAIDHNETSNRTHNGDNLSPDTLEATDVDLGKLLAALNANNQDISNVRDLDADILEAGTSITDPANNTITDFVGSDLALENGTLKALTSPDVRTSLNDLFVRNAEQDFELGLTQLGYRSGQFEIFANNNKVSSTDNLVQEYGSVTSGAGYVALEVANTGDISGSIQESEGLHTSDIVNIALENDIGFTASFDGDVKKFDKSTLLEQDTFTSHSNEGASSRSVATDGSHGYSGGANPANLYKWDIDTMTEQETLSHNDAILTIATSDGFGYFGSKDGVVKKWDTDTLTEQASISFPSRINEIQVRNDHLYIAEGENVHKHDKDTLDFVDAFFQKVDGTVSGVTSISITDKFGYSGDGAGNVAKWDIDTLSKQNEFTGQGSVINCLSVQNNFGYTGGSNGNVVRWDTETLTEQDREFISGESVESLEVEGQFVFAGEGSGSVIKIGGNGTNGKTEGFIEHLRESFDFIPNTAVVSDDVRKLPTGTDIYYEITDDAGNSVTIQRSDIDGEVDVSALTSSNISTTANLERTNTDTPTPELDSWAVYFNE